MPDNLIFLAGEKAFSRIKDNGLKPEMVSVIAGAAGGPKWLVLSSLDRVLFSNWLRHRSTPLFLVGSSIAAWRFAAIAQNNPLDALERFQTAYLNQSYSAKPTAREISEETCRIRDAYLDDQAVEQVLEHPTMRLNFMAVRSKGLNAYENKILLGAGLLGSALANVINRKLLKLFFERTLFYHPKTQPPFFETSEFPIQKVPLCKENIKDALLASGSIPLVISGVKGIQGAADGTYRDGGVIDYHMDIPFLPASDEGIVLYPHYSRRVIPGWLDKKLTRRKPNPSHMINVLLAAPSESFIDSLPFGKIPDRNDFWTFAQKDRDRIAYWNTVIERSTELGEEFMEAVESGSIVNRIQPMKL